MSVNTMLSQDKHGVEQSTPCHSIHSARAIVSEVKSKVSTMAFEQNKVRTQRYYVVLCCALV